MKLKKISSSLVHLLSALIILTAVASPWFDLYLSNHSFVKTYTAGIGISALLLITLWLKKPKNIISYHLSPMKITWLGLFMLGTLSVFWSTNVDFSITKWLIWFTTFCAFIVTYHLKINQKTLTQLSWGLLIAAFCIAVIGILQYLFDPFTLSQAAIPSSTFGNKNMATQPIVLIWPVALFLLFSSKIQKKQVWVVSIMFALIMVFIFYTRTRASWVGIAAQLILIVGFFLIKYSTWREWINWNRDKTKAILSAFGLFLLLVSFNKHGFVPFLSEVNSTITNIEGTSTSRFSIWLVAIDMIQASPIFGTGLGSWFQNEIQGGFGTHNVMVYQRAHNDFLELGVELGIVGMLLLLIATTYTIIACFKIINQKQPPFALFHLLIWVSLAGSFVQMQFSFPYQLAMPALLLGVYLGIIARHSEAFVTPIKIISFKPIKRYYHFIFAFFLVITIITSSIYIDWRNSYSMLNNLNKKGKIEQLHLAIPIIYHLELQNIFEFLAQAYLKQNNFDKTIGIEQQVLKYWPNANISLYRYAFALMNKGRYEEALKAAKHLKKVSGHGSYNGHLVELSIYKSQNNSNAFIQAFEELMQEDKSLLALNHNTYEQALQFSLMQPKLIRYSQGIYQKYRQVYGYKCIVENNIAALNLVIKNYTAAKKHVDIIQNSQDDSCLKPSIVKKLRQQGFIIQGKKLSNLK